MEKTKQELANEITEHTENALRSFREGQIIHRAYRAAPDQQNLTDEVTAFSEKLSAGIAEMDKVTGLRKELLDQ